MKRIPAKNNGDIESQSMKLKACNMVALREETVYTSPCTDKEFSFNSNMNI